MDSCNVKKFLEFDLYYSKGFDVAMES